MRDPARIPVLLEALRTVWETEPDTRLTQLIINLLDARPNPMFYIDDDAVLAQLEARLAEIAKAAPNVGSPTLTSTSPLNGAAEQRGQRFDLLEWNHDDGAVWVNEAPEKGWDRVAVVAINTLPGCELQTPWLGCPAVIFRLQKRSDIDRIVRELMSSPQIRLLVVDPEKGSEEAEALETALLTLWGKQKGVALADPQGVLSDIVKHISTTWDTLRDVKLVLGKPHAIGEARLGRKLPSPHEPVKRQALHLTCRQYPPTPVESCPMCLPPLVPGFCPAAIYDRATGAMSRCRREVHSADSRHDDGCLSWLEDAK